MNRAGQQIHDMEMTDGQMDGASITFLEARQSVLCRGLGQRMFCVVQGAKQDRRWKGRDVNHARLASRDELEKQGRGIVEALGGRWSGTTGMCRCPAHEDRAPSLSVRMGATSLLFHCFAGCNTADMLREIRRAGALTGGMVIAWHVAGQRREPKLQAIVDRLWATSRAVAGTIAGEYLARRGLSANGAQLRFHPSVQLGPRGEATYHPALLAAVRDDTGLVAIQRIFLDPATRTKAAFDNPKRMLGTPGRGAVRLGVSGKVLGIAEGLETALSASLIHGIPVWAVLGNERFGMIDVPTGVERIVVLADNDVGGRRAAGLAEAGLARPGRTISGLWPPAPHNDWNDLLMAEPSRNNFTDPKLAG